MHVRYWRINETGVANRLPMSLADIANHLLQDWLPRLSPSPGQDAFGWPALALCKRSLAGTRYWAVNRQLGRSDRQWKTLISWMLGVAGARHLLTDEGYIWIAPISAFRQDDVDMAPPPDAFHPSTVQVCRDMDENRRGDLPDFVAVTEGTNEPRTVAIVEAKGRPSDLTYMSEPDEKWEQQALRGRLLVDKVEKDVQRIVVATRVNQNARSDTDRIVQIRGWNCTKQPTPNSDALTVAIVRAHLYGLCLNVGLNRCARALAVRNNVPDPDRAALSTREVRDREIARVRHGERDGEHLRVRRRSGGRAYEIEVHKVTVKLLLDLPDLSDEAAVRRLTETEDVLDKWYRERVRFPGESRTRAGVAVRFRGKADRWAFCDRPCPGA